MSNAYYILEDEEQKGPFTLKELIALEPDIYTRVMPSATNEWVDACDLEELQPYFESQGFISLPGII